MVQVPRPADTMLIALLLARPVMAMAMAQITTQKVSQLLLQVMLEPQGSCCLFPVGRLISPPEIVILGFQTC